MTKIDLKKALAFFIACASIVLLINFVVLIAGRADAKDNEKWVTHTHEVIQLSQQLFIQIQNAETGQRGFLLTEDNSYLAPYLIGIDRIQELLRTLQNKTKDNPSQQTRLLNLSTLIDAKLRELKRTIDLANNNEKAAALRLVRSDLGQSLMQQIRQLLDEFNSEEQALLAVRKENHAFSKNRHFFGVMFAEFLLLIVVLTSIFVLNRRVIEPIRQLTKAAQRYDNAKKADFSIPPSTSEIEKLSSTLRNMAHNVSTYVGALTESKQKSEELANVKSTFLANMSHEIRTPLNGIYGTLQLIGNEEQSTKSTQLIERAMYSVKSLNAIVNDVLDISKIEKGKLNIEETTFNMNELIELSLTDVAIHAHNKGISFTLNNSVETPFWLGDPVRIKQVIDNLVSNALKFTHSGDVYFNIEENADSSGITLTVKDTGIGMTQSEQQRLFQRFEQADSTITRRFGGTGLGMAITHQLVTLMCGTIKVESTFGEGSTFRVSIPLTRSTDPVNTIEKEQEEHVSLNDKTVLIVEDNDINRLIISEAIEALGTTPTQAENGAEGFNQFKKKQFDIVLMDIQMPVLDGIEACKLMKKDNSKIPVVALTANVMADDKAIYAASGFDAVLEKPLDLNALNSTLRQLVT
jgi:signal transduction histidine kinase